MSRTVETWKSSPAVVEAALDDEIVLLNVESGIYFGLDELGTTIWSMVTQGTDEQAVVDQIVAEYDVERVQAQLDVADFLAHLAAKGLLQHRGTVIDA